MTALLDPAHLYPDKYLDEQELGGWTLQYRTDSGDLTEAYITAPRDASVAVLAELCLAELDGEQVVRVSRGAGVYAEISIVDGKAGWMYL